MERLEKLGMRKMKVPLDVDEGEPHSVVLVSGDFEQNKEKLAVLVCGFAMSQLTLDAL